MSQRILQLPYGHKPYELHLPDHIEPTVVLPAEPGPAKPIKDVVSRALDEPIEAARLESAVRPGDRVVVAVSDATRDDPRDLMLRALLARMPADIRLTIAVANGTHGLSDLDRLHIGSDLWSRSSVVNHNAHDSTDLVLIGTTERGTPVRLHRCLVETDWVIATGRIKPHYFAGYGAGCKPLFPGLGSNREVRINHQLKSEPGSRPGVVEGNPCREDLEEAVDMLQAQKFLLNIVADSRGGAQGAVAGHLTHAFRRGAALCEPFFRVDAPAAQTVVVSDQLPVTGSLYQASKLAAAAAPVLAENGTLIIVAECPHGIGPVDTVNRAIYEIGLAPRLPNGHRIVLVSGLDEREVKPSYCQWAPSVESVLQELGSQSSAVTILPKAGSLIVHKAS